MENLEKEIINRLNKLLSKYNLKIIINDYNLLDIVYFKWQPTNTGCVFQPNNVYIK
jgi:hypothetical protein